MTVKIDPCINVAATYTHEAGGCALTYIFSPLIGSPMLVGNATAPQIINLIINTSITINLAEDGPPAYPFPTFIVWAQNNQTVSNDSRRSFGYPSLTFTSVEQSDSGLYLLRAANFRVDLGRITLGTKRGYIQVFVLCT